MENVETHDRSRGVTSLVSHGFLLELVQPSRPVERRFTEVP